MMDKDQMDIITDKTKWLKDRWLAYLKYENITLTPIQGVTAEHFIEFLANNREVSSFFVGRRTGVSFLFKHLEAFCRSEPR